MSDLDVRKQHATWLTLIESGGPFLTLPVLTKVLAHGLDPIRKPDMDALRLAWSTWEAEQGGKNPERAQAEWVGHVVQDLLGWEDDADFEPPPGKWEHTEPEYGTLTAAAFTLNDPDQGEPALLGFTVPYGSSLTARSTDGWSASALDRVAVTLREHDIPLGLLTDGRWWGLVWAPRGGATAHALWDSVLWIEDRVTLEAFVTLLGRRRTLGVAEASTLLGMLKASLDSQEEVTDQLGRQVRAAVEMLVDSISRTDEQARSRAGEGAVGYLDGVSSDTVYEAAVTVLMRLVFMLAAEERRLLPVDDDLYAKSYGIATLGNDLDLRAADEGEDALDHGLGAWQRMLAGFRVVHDGADHHDFRLPGYGGGLFDPDRYPWLEGRTVGGVLPPMPIDDRTVRRVVRSLMWLEFRDKGVRENRRVTYRALDVEQIGYVYEGLLDHNAVRADSWVLGFAGPNEPEIRLSDVTAQAASSGDGLAAWLGKQMGKPATWVSQRLGESSSADERDDLWRRVLAATDNDERQARLLLPFARLLRDDQRGLPVVIPPGRLYVTASSARSDTGAHYTPRVLAESVVAGALEPLVYKPGPLQTLDRSQWRVGAPETILSLHVADIAMGSGAFLVAACRYLADRLIEAILAAEPDSIKDSESITLWFLLHDQEAGTDTVDEEADEALIQARRLIVERCLYGADINPLAVEMAKLSLWLITSAQHRPFSFLDHRLVAGDSLLGLTSLAQLEDLHVMPGRGRTLHADTLLQETAHVRRQLAEAARSRHEIAARPSTDLREVQFKATQLLATDHMLADLALLADGLVAAGLGGAKQGDALVDSHTIRVAGFAPELLGAEPNTPEHARAREAAEAFIQAALQADRPLGAAVRKPVQWLTRFPEVFLGAEDAGFDAIIGNPPFLGGQKITGAAGVAYREHLVRHIGGGTRGSADLVAYFFLVAHALLRARGHLALIATNTVAQGDTREVGLDRIVADGLQIRAAVRSRKWPTRGAHLEYAIVWGTRDSLAAGTVLLDGDSVAAITPSLEARSRVAGKPQRLSENKGRAFIGSYVLGSGFLLTPEQGADLIRRDSRNAEVVMPYLSGEDLNGRPDSTPSRMVINFQDWPLERAAEYRECLGILERTVQPSRAHLAERNTVGKRRATYWWQYGSDAKVGYERISNLTRVLAITLHSKTVTPTFVPSAQVFTHGMAVFAYDDGAHAAILSSAFHREWAIEHASTMRTDIRYTPSDCFETFPQPALPGEELLELGEAFDAERRIMLLAAGEGLTAFYNRYHRADCTDGDVTQLRRRQEVLDAHVAAAYGWSDLHLDHGFYDTRYGLRFTISPASRVELLDRLRELNLHRGLSEPPLSVARKRTGLSALPTRQESLFDEGQE